MTTRTYPAPVTGPESKPFWAAASEGRFLLKHCDDCSRNHWYPRALCPFCMSARTSWVESAGRGTIYSFSVMRRVKVPYALAYVKLDDGPTMLANVISADLDHLAIGSAVTLMFVPAEGGGKIPVFQPA